MNKTISLCMLVKNEEKNIDRVLRDIYTIFDEIVIVDTGSNDDTLKTIKKYTDKIYYFELKNNFSDARNYLISRTQSDYIFILDADEEIKKEYLIKLREILNFSHNKDVYFINIFENLNGIKSQELQARLFRNTNKIKYKYSVYENIYDSIEDNNLTYTTLDNINIEHFKFENIDKVKSSYSDLKRILENEISKEDLDINEKSYYILKLIHIYTTYYFIGYERVVYLINYFFEITKNNALKNSLFIPRNLHFNNYLIGMLYQNKDFQKMEEIAKNIYPFYNNSLNILYYLFIISLGKNNKEEALNYVNKAKNLILHKSYFKFETIILDYINEQFNNFLSEINNNFRLTQQNIKNKKLDINKNISLCILSLDNIINENLEKIFDIFDEVIIVSNNIPEEKYKSEKIKIYNLEFNNDISELKNFAISLAESKYILFLNSYEYIKEDNIKKLTEHVYNPVLYSLRINILEYDENNNLLDIKNEIRFFRNDNKIFFNNRIFENINLSIFNEISNNFLSVQNGEDIFIIKNFSEQREKNKLDLINNVINKEENLLNKIFLYYKKYLIEKYFNYPNFTISLFQSFKLLENKNINILSYNNYFSRYLIEISKLMKNNENVMIDLYYTNINIFPWEYKTYQKLGEIFFNKNDLFNSKMALNKSLEIINNNPIYQTMKPKYIQDDIYEINKIIDEINKKNNISLVTFEENNIDRYKSKFENIFIIKNSIKELLERENNSGYFIILRKNEEVNFNSNKLNINDINQTALIKIEYENLIWYENRLLSENFLRKNYIDVNEFIFINNNNYQKLEDIYIKSFENPYKNIKSISNFDINNIKSLIYYDNLLSDYLENNNNEFDNIIKLFDIIENIPSIYYKKGLKLLKEENYKEAMKSFHKCMELGGENNFYPYIPFDKGIISYLSMYQIGICYLKQNKKQLAKIFFEQSLEENENFEEAKIALNNLE